MEAQYQKWVNLSYLALAGLLGFVFFTLAAKVVGVYDLETRFHNIEFIILGLSWLLGAVAFFVLWRNDQINEFMNQVAIELSRVTWPTQKETTVATFVVIVMVIITGVILWFLDNVWTMLIGWVL